jgi:hypothetical protein
VEERPPATDAALATGVWVVGETYEVVDAIDRVDVSGHSWLPLQGRPVSRRSGRDGRLASSETDMHDRSDPGGSARGRLRPGEQRVRLIVDTSPDPRTRAARVWGPGDRAGLADELVALGQADEAAIVRWITANGFIGIRADPHEWHESIQEIRAALAFLGQARSLIVAIRAMSGDELRAETERLLSLPPGLLKEVQADPISQPMAGPWLAREFGIVRPKDEAWPGAGAHIQALYALSSVLQAPLERFLRVRTTIAPTGDGMRLQGAIVAAGPLATAYLRTLDEASWAAITYVGSLLRINWQTPRPCGRCGRTFRPTRRGRKWCSDRCRWAASKARHSRLP